MADGEADDFSSAALEERLMPSCSVPPVTSGTTNGRLVQLQACHATLSTNTSLQFSSQLQHKVTGYKHKEPMCGCDTGQAVPVALA